MGRFMYYNFMYLYIYKITRTPICTDKLYIYTPGTRTIKQVVPLVTTEPKRRVDNNRRYRVCVCIRLSDTCGTRRLLLSVFVMHTTTYPPVPLRMISDYNYPFRVITNYMKKKIKK